MIKSKDKSWYFLEWEKMLRAGLPMDRVVGMLGDALERLPGAGRMRAWHAGVQGGMKEGMPLAKAFAVEGAANPLDLALLESGERGGKLEESMRHLGDYYALMGKLRRRVVSKLWYPVILLHAALLLPLVPKWVQMVVMGQRSDGMHPLWEMALTLGLVYAVFVLGVVLLRMLWKMGEEVVGVDLWWARWPVLGKARTYLAMTRFCKVFHMGLLAALPMRELLQQSGAASRRAGLEAGAMKAAKLIQEGADLQGGLRGGGGFGVDFLNAVETAEVAGVVDKEMARWAILEQERAEESLSVLSTWVPRGIYFLALLFGAWKVVTMFGEVYLAPLRSLGV